ncbi:MAG: hypothetical protein IPM84_14665 [Anaerolineae bacterium]|nr:hypothetical protein [Anaerolineae bacterium]
MQTITRTQRSSLSGHPAGGAGRRRAARHARPPSAPAARLLSAYLRNEPEPRRRRAAINQTFDQRSTKAGSKGWSHLLNQVDRSRAFASRHGAYIPHAFPGHIRQYKRPFVYYDPNGERLDVLVVRLHRESSLERARTMQRNFIAHYLRQDHNEPVEAVLAAFYHDDVAGWRFRWCGWSMPLATRGWRSG